MWMWEQRFLKVPIAAWGSLCRAEEPFLYFIRFLCVARCVCVCACELGVLQLLTSSAKHRKSIAQSDACSTGRAERENLQLWWKHQTLNSGSRANVHAIFPARQHIVRALGRLLLPISSERWSPPTKHSQISHSPQSLFLIIWEKRHSKRTPALGTHFCPPRFSSESYF